MGQGVAVVEQIPSKISPDVIKNSNTKIVHRLVSKDDQSLLAGSLGIADSDALYLNRLKTGNVLCHKEGMGRPIECAVLSDVDSHAISNDKVKRLMENSINYKPLHSHRVYQMDTWLRDEGKKLCIRFFNSLILLQASEIEKLVSKAKYEMNRVCVLKNIPYELNDSLFGDYFSLQVLKLLSKGIYFTNNPIPRDLKAKLCEVASQPNQHSHKQLVDLLNDLWKPTCAMNFIEDVIANLSFHYLYQNNADVNITNIQSVIGSFMLIKDENIIKNIGYNIQRKMESNHD